MSKKVLISSLIVIALVAVATGAYYIQVSAQGGPVSSDLLNASYRGRGPRGTGTPAAGGIQANGAGTQQRLQDPSADPAAVQSRVQDPTFLIAADGNPLSAAELDGLVFMYEEEKLAHDVYLALYDAWQFPTFSSIARSEAQHMASVEAVLQAYDQEVPANAQGVFDNADLQALYNQLVAQGQVSLADALKVGAAIEEIDILDLQERLAATQNSAIQQVYNNLLRGSTNHLRAFSNALQVQTGASYSPQYLSAEAYASLVAGMPGNGYRGGNK